MAPWERIVVGALVAAGIAGGITGWRDVAAQRAAADAASARRVREIEQARAEGRRLVLESELTVSRMKEAAETARAAVEPPPAEIEAVRRREAVVHLTDLIRKGILTAPMSAANVARLARSGDPLPAAAVGSDGQLSPGFGAFFDLSEGEVARLQARLDDLRVNLESMLVANTTMRRTETGLVLEYKATEEATRLRDATIAAFKETLGEEKYQQFTVLNGERVGDNGARIGGPWALFEALGAEGRTITLKATEQGLEYSQETTRGGRGSGFASNPEVVQTMLGPFGRLLPKEFLDSIPRPVGRGGGGGGTGVISRGGIFSGGITGGATRTPVPDTPPATAK